MERQSVDSISSICALNPAAVLCRITDPGKRCMRPDQKSVSVFREKVSRFKQIIKED